MHRMVDKSHCYLYSIGLTLCGQDKMVAIFASAKFKYIFLNENFWISNQISLEYVPVGHINNIPLLIQIMGYHRTGVKPLSEPMMT